MGIDLVVLARFVLTGIALLLAFLAAVTWDRRREAPEAGIFAILLACMAVYTFGYAGEVAQTAISGAKFWLNVEYLAVPWVGALCLLAACRHNGFAGRTPLLFAIPAIAFAGYYTNFHNLFYLAPIGMERRGPFWVLTFQRGPIATLHIAYLMVAFLAGSWMYLRGLRNSSALFRRQAAVLLTASLLPTAAYCVYFAGLSPWGLDITPLALGATCALLYYGIFHCGMFDLAPLARALIFNSMRDAVLILDTRDRLLDFNPAAKTLLPVLNKRNLGLEIGPMLAGIPNFAKAIARQDEQTEIAMGGDDERWYEIRAWPLFASAADPSSRRIGRAVIFADVTSWVQLQEELRGRAEIDPLTGAANRRRFLQLLEIECLRFARNRLPLSVMTIDLDSLERINGRYRRPVGDSVLRTVAQLLLLSLRKTDLLARYGGEEFAVLLPETALEGARVIAERIRETIVQKPILADGFELEVSISVGVASHASDGEADPEELIKNAEMALTRAKLLGRNRVEVS